MGEKKCEVMQDDENLTRTKEKCQFPFKFRGKEYDRCICIGDKRCLRWCPTKLDENRETEKAPGTWGYCGKYCPLGYGDKCKNRKRIPRFLEEWKVDPILKKNLLKSKAHYWAT